MGDVYRLASKTWIWLGLDHEKCLNQIRRFQSLIPVLPWAYKLLFKGIILTNPEQDGLSNFVSLSKSSWFDRVWTLQELLLSSSPYAVSGKTSVSWKIVETCAKGIIFSNRMFLGNNSMYQQDYIHLARNWLDLISCRRARKLFLASSKGHHRSIKHRAAIELLKITRYRDCTDPRDQIYGIRELLLDYEVEVPDPDYNRPAYHIWEDVCVAIMQFSGELVLLELIHSPNQQSYLPSWVPNLAVSGTQTLGDVSKDVEVAMGTLIAEPHQFSRSIRYKNHNLDLRGQVLGSIKASTARISHLEALDELSVARDDISSLRIWARFIKHHNSNSNELKTEAFSPGGLIRGPFRNGTDKREFDKLMQCHFSALFEIYTDVDDPEYRDKIVKNASWLKELDSDTDMFAYFLIRAHDGLAKLHKQFNQWQGMRKTMFITVDGTLGLSDGDIQVGDQIVLLYGARKPIILRKSGDFYRLIGTARVHGIAEDIGDMYETEHGLDRFILI